MNDKKKNPEGSQIVIRLFVTVTHTAYLDNGTATGLTADNDKIPSESWVVNNSPLEIQWITRDSQGCLYGTQENSLWYMEIKFPNHCFGNSSPKITNNVWEIERNTLYSSQ